MSDQKPIAPAPPGSSHIIPSQLKPASGRVSSACRMCRIRKSKCDGGNPCSKCITRKSPCIYENYDRRKERAALQHDFNRLTQTLRAHEELLNSLRTGDKQDIDDLINLLREHETIGDVVKQFQRRGSRVKPRPSFSGSQTGTEVSEVGSESQGEGPSGDGDTEMYADGVDGEDGVDGVDGVGSSVDGANHPLSASSTEAPSDWPGKFDPLSQAGSSSAFGNERHESISQPFASLGLASTISPHPPTSDCSQVASSGWHDTFWPSPWTTVTDENDSTTLSHLMSHCAEWTRPMYSFINLDLFFRDLRSRRLDRKFCSPTLVNAASAMSCLICNLPAALADPLETDSCGEHFAAEAKKMLNSRHKKNDLPSAQSLALLSIVEASRRRNTASWWYSALFFNMCLELGLPSHNQRVVMSHEGDDESGVEKQQLGLAAASFAIFFMERFVVPRLSRNALPQKIAYGKSVADSRDRRIWFNFLKASAPSNMTDLPLATVSALQKSGNDHLAAPRFNAHGVPTTHHHAAQHALAAAYADGTASRDKGKTVAAARAQTTASSSSSHSNYVPDELDLNQLIKDMLQFMSTQWNFQSSRDLVALHSKLKAWLFL